MIKSPTINPTSLTGVDRFYNNLRYGETNRETVDLFLPSSGTPTGLVMFFHGGGFVVGNTEAGSLSQTLLDDIQVYLDNGIAYAYCNYILMNFYNEKEGLLDTLECGSRIIQFFIDNASALNLDITKFCMIGSSGGNGMIMHHLHYGNHNLDSVVLRSPQASYDPDRYTEILSNEGFNVREDMENYSLSRLIYLRGIGGRNISDLDTPINRIKRQQVDYLNLAMTSSIGEAYIETLNFPTPIDGNPTIVSHHYRQCLAIGDKFTSQGIPFNYNMPNADSPFDITNSESINDFIVRRLS